MPSAAPASYSNAAMPEHIASASARIANLFGRMLLVCPSWYPSLDTRHTGWWQ